MNPNTSRGKAVTSNSSVRKMVELKEMKRKAPDELAKSGSTDVLFDWIHSCTGMASDCMTEVQASLGSRQRDLASTETNKGLLLKDNDQIQASSVYDVEES